ncbi:MAG: efflux transporter periplasmic adaptor subunit, partial [Phycisphaerae bacterium]|nr:efflux transporter periplasmic adaptor subunit [Phycisphaerae bacterium]
PQIVEVRTRVKGFLQTVEFTDGTKVQKGDLLYTIEPEQFEAAVAAADATLQSAIAERKLRDAMLERINMAASQGAASQVEMLEAQARSDAAAADVNKAQADLKNARLELEYTKIHAPISGRLSRNFVTEGNLVGSGDSTLLTTIREIDPIQVYFEVNERDLIRLIKIDQDRKEKDGTDVDPPVAYLDLTDGSRYEEAGVVEYSDNMVDRQTGTMEVRASFPNPRRMLVEGLFVRVQVPQKTAEAMLVPEVALQRDVVGAYLMVVDADETVQRRDVRLGKTVDGDRVIESGIEPDDRVIVNGLQRAQPGNKVVPTMADTNS